VLEVRKKLSLRSVAAFMKWRYILSDPDTALDTLVRDEMGIDPDELGGSARYSSSTIFRGSLPVRNSGRWIKHEYTFS